MIKRTILLSIVSLFLLIDASGQVDRSGFIFGIGIGSGYSKHAGSYSVVKDPAFGIIDEYSGFRILATDLKVGWGFAPRAQVHYTIKYTPPNSTISPYQFTSGEFSFLVSINYLFYRDSNANSL